MDDGQDTGQATGQSLPDRDALQALVEAGDWHALIAATEGLTEQRNCPVYVFVLRARALHETTPEGSLSDEALALVEAVIARAPGTLRAYILRMDIRIRAGELDAALAELRAYLDSPAGRKAGDALEPVRSAVVDRAMFNGRPEVAKAVNETRKAIASHRGRARHAIAVQCFNKADTLRNLLQSLRACIGAERFALVVLQDSPKGSKKEAVYTPAAAEVMAVLAEELPALTEVFDTVEIFRNPENMGTAPTCRRLLDRVAARYDGFIFLEDDCILSRDALLWTEYHLAHTIGRGTAWFAACESVFFDSKTVKVPEAQLARLRRIAARPDLRHAYFEIHHVPSSCFITTAAIWADCAGFRSFPRGPLSLNHYLEASGARTLMPIVPRASDTGMLHEMGYSVAMLGDRVHQFKTTYCLSELEDLPEDAPRLFEGGIGHLFSATVELSDEAIDRLLPKGGGGNSGDGAAQ